MGCLQAGLSKTHLNKDCQCTVYTATKDTRLGNPLLNFILSETKGKTVQMLFFYDWPPTLVCIQVPILETHPHCFLLNEKSKFIFHYYTQCHKRTKIPYSYQGRNWWWAKWAIVHPAFGRIEGAARQQQHAAARSHLQYRIELTAQRGLCVLILTEQDLDSLKNGLSLLLSH